MPSALPQHEIEEQIRKDFQIASNELERAPGNEKAVARLNRAMRRLYDFVGYGKIPQDLQLKRSTSS